MTIGPLEPVQACSGSVSIYIKAVPSQLLSAHILTKVNFLINSFMLDVLGVLVIVFYIDWTQSLGKSVFCQTTVGIVFLMDRKCEKLN